MGLWYNSYQIITIIARTRRVADNGACIRWTLSCVVISDYSEGWNKTLLHYQIQTLVLILSSIKQIIFKHLSNLLSAHGRKSKFALLLCLAWRGAIYVITECVWCKWINADKLFAIKSLLGFFSVISKKIALPQGLMDFMVLCKLTVALTCT